MSDTPRCIVCTADAWEPTLDVLLRCRQCGFVRADLDLDASQLKDVYTENYFQGGEYGDYLGDRDVHRRNIERRFGEMEARAGRPKAVFEIGCAYGLWLEYLTEMGIRAAGIDISPEPVEHAVTRLGQEAVAGDFLELDLQPGEYDTFCMWDTIEHLANPDAFVARIFQLLPPGGWLFATTGDLGSRQARRRGRRWRMIHPPTHLQYFSTDSMGRFLDRLGFVDISIHPVPIYRDLRSVLGSLVALRGGATKRVAQVFSAAIPAFVQTRIGAWIDLGDIMLVSARRPKTVD